MNKEDIKILEKVIEDKDTKFWIGTNGIEALENLIKGYKEIEKELKIKTGDVDYLLNKINKHFIDDVTLQQNYISKSKIKEIILIPMKEEHDKAMKEIMKKDTPQCVNAGDVAQELGYFIGKIEELLEEK